MSIIALTLYGIGKLLDALFGKNEEVSSWV